VSKQLTFFISSTVLDFGGVRDELAAHLRRRGHLVLLSEERSFPVEPGVHSHDACLSAIRNATVFILLVGQRYGGEYLGQNKSITWREWEEAIDNDLMLVVLVEAQANAAALEVFRARRQLTKAQPELTTTELDNRLRKKFPDAKPARQNLPGVQRFIDALRKGHTDNWLRNDWNGTPDDALRTIDSRCGAALSTYHSKTSGVRQLAKAQATKLTAIKRFTALASLCIAKVHADKMSAREAHQRLLEFAESRRNDLFGFRDGDRFNLMIYHLDDRRLIAGARVHDPRIQPRNREWAIGEGHVGLAVKENTLLVSGDLRETGAWSPRRAPSDYENYVSAVSVPLYFAATQKPDGVLIVTSSRLDHFKDSGAPEILTIQTVGSILSMIGAANGHANRDH